MIQIIADTVIHEVGLQAKAYVYIDILLRLLLVTSLEDL